MKGVRVLFDLLVARASKALALVGVILLILGLTAVNPLSFSDVAAVLVSLGGFFIISSILLRFQISRNSTVHQKMFALLASASIVLLTAAVVVFTVVKVDFQLQNGQVEDAVVGSMPGHGRTMYEDTDARMVIPVVTHVYSVCTTYLLVLAFLLIVLSIYTKTKFL
jgi:hypothetical protein